MLFVEGEELVGAKQNRILNTSILVAAHTKLKIPVSCVEQGRWGYRSRHFGSSGSHSPSKVRYALRKGVSDSLKTGGGHRSNQGDVWAKVSGTHAEHGTHSDTGAMSDAFAQKQKEIDDVREKLGYVENATGVAVTRREGARHRRFRLSLDLREGLGSVAHRVRPRCPGAEQGREVSRQGPGRAAALSSQRLAVEPGRDGWRGNGVPNRGRAGSRLGTDVRPTEEDFAESPPGFRSRRPSASASRAP